VKVPAWLGVPDRTSRAFPVEPVNPEYGVDVLVTVAVIPGIEPVTLMEWG
jgi:hypothetical protein